MDSHLQFIFAIYDIIKYLLHIYHPQCYSRVPCATKYCSEVLNGCVGLLFKHRENKLRLRRWQRRRQRRLSNVEVRPSIRRSVRPSALWCAVQPLFVLFLPVSV
jgi:hypothetical protein